ncbi:MAG TPA: WYL domain-containing protein [Egibacteraceae bacterium]|nr:WYL domain-containing protein [Egibacteraceae bacterium]
MNRPARTLQRLERILTMVPWLLDHPGVSLDEVSERFGVDRDELADDLDILGYCGLPGYGGGDLVEVALMGDRVTVRMADFFARPLTLSMREAVTLLLAARALATVEGLEESGALRRATVALERLLGGHAARVEVDLRTDGDQWLAPARQAVQDRRVVHLVYRSAAKAQTTARDVEPWAVVGHLGAWYLQGYCRLAQGPRDFRLDRVKQLEVTDETVVSAPTSPGPPVYQPAEGDRSVTLDLAPEAWWVAEWAVVDDEHIDGETRRVTLRTPGLEWAARLVVQLGGQATVVHPPELAERVAELATETLSNYGAASR